MPLPVACRPLDLIPRRYNCRAGFTLIEMAVALFVITLLLGSLLAPLSQQVDQRKIAEAQKVLDQINDALMGFALSQTPPRLPCPDTNGDGIEEVSGSAACPSTASSTTGGTVPWVTLGVPATDPWGQRYQYRVNGMYASTITLGIDASVSGAGVIRVCSDNTCATLIANKVPAVAYSPGPNGATQPPASPDELENTTVAGHVNNDRTFVSRTFSSIPGAEFDDIVTYLSAPILLNRLVSAQKLP